MSHRASTRATCSSCLFYDGMRVFLERATLNERLCSVRIESNGRCNVCNAYAEQFQPRELDESLDLLRAMARDGRGRPVLVAVSGGKDSLATLVLAKRELGLDVVAVHFDNGFIPDVVSTLLEHACDRLEVKLRVRSASTLERRALSTALESLAVERETPCASCSSGIHAALDDASREFGADAVILGTNYFLNWPDLPRSRARRSRPDGSTLQYFSLPYALRRTRGELLSTLRSESILPHELPGVSTNCSIPSLVQDRIGAQLGHIPEMEMLSLETLVGHITRDEALAELERQTSLNPKLRSTLDRYSSKVGPRRG